MRKRKLEFGNSLQEWVCIIALSFVLLWVGQDVVSRFQTYNLTPEEEEISGPMPGPAEGYFPLYQEPKDPPSKVMRGMLSE